MKLIFLLSAIFLVFISGVLLSQEPGTLKWTFQTGGEIRSSPAIGNDSTIYVGSWSYNNKLYAINPDGTEKWSFVTADQITYSKSSPVIGDDGTVYFSSNDDKLYAVNPDGTEKWSLEGIKGSPAIDVNGSIYVESDSGELYAINPDGTEKWSFGTEDQFTYSTSSPVIGDDGTVCISSNDDKLYAINPDGSEKWSLDIEGGLRSKIAIGADGTIYLGSDDGKLCAINPDGKEKWLLVLGSRSAKRSVISTSPLIATDGTIYFASTNLENYSRLYAIDPLGDVKWSVDTDCYLYSSPVIGANGTIYTAYDDHISVINPDGTFKCWYSFGNGYGANYSSPTIGVDGTLYVGSGDKFYAIQTESGGLADSPWPKFRGNVRNQARSKDVGHPVAIVVSNQIHADLGTTVELDASLSYDTEGNSLTYLWHNLRKLNDAMITLSDSTSAKTQVTCSAPGLYKVGLTVANSLGVVANNIVYLHYAYWAFEIDEVEFASSPAIGSDGMVYIITAWGFNATIEDMKLYALNPDGTVKWSYFVDYEYCSSPAIGVDETVYVGIYNSLYAFNPDGTEKWSFITGGRIPSSPTIGVDGTIYCTSGDSKLYAINPDGTEKWSFATNESIEDSSPAISADGTIYVGAGMKLFALNPDGTKKWSFATAGHVDSSPAIGADETIYFGSWDGKFYAINPNGTKKWSFVTGEPFYASPALDLDGSIYIGSHRNLYAIHPDGTEKWSFSTGGVFDSSPAIGSNGTIYIGSTDNKIYAINPDGTEQWSFSTGAIVTSSPAIDSSGTVYIGSWDGKFYAIQTKNGGLADSPWPKYKQNNQNTGRATGNHINQPCTNFYADTTIGAVPLTVYFTDSSTGDITSWHWDFGDGNTSQEQHPTHVYETADSFDVTLIVTGPWGSDTLSKEAYIHVMDLTGIDVYSFQAPKEFALYQNYPNPFNPSTKICYAVKEACHVHLSVYNLKGQIIKTLIDSHQESGHYSLDFNMIELPSGIYFYRIRMNNFSDVKKMMKLE